MLDLAEITLLVKKKNWTWSSNPGSLTPLSVLLPWADVSLYLNVNKYFSKALISSFNWKPNLKLNYLVKKMSEIEFSSQTRSPDILLYVLVIDIFSLIMTPVVLVLDEKFDFLRKGSPPRNWLLLLQKDSTNLVCVFIIIGELSISVCEYYFYICMNTDEIGKWGFYGILKLFWKWTHAVHAYALPLCYKLLCT